MIRVIVGYILDWFFGKLVQLYKKHKESKKADDAIDEKVQKQAEAVKRSKSDQEDIDAAREILSRNK